MIQLVQFWPYHFMMDIEIHETSNYVMTISLGI